MPTVVGIRVKCPECGATATATGDVVRCAYCGTESRVQRRTTVFQQRIPLPPQQPQQPQRVAVQQKTNAVALIFGVTIAALMIPIGVMALGAAKVSRQNVINAKAQQQEQKKQAAVIYRDWETARPMFADVDGDVIPDLVGIVRYTSDRDEMRLAAHSGKDGKKLWESNSLGKYNDTYQAKVTIVDNIVVWGSTQVQRLEGYDVKTGKRVWQTTPDEALESYCRANDHFIVMLKDETQYTLDRTNGALTKLPKKIQCRAVDAITDDTSELWGANLEGMGVHGGFKDANGWIVEGGKSPGTPIPMLAALDKKKKVLWRAQLPAHDPMTAQRVTWSYLGFDEELVAEVVLYNKNQPYLEVFDRQTGARKLDAPLTISKERMQWLHTANVTVKKDAIYVLLDSNLQAYARTTGTLLWQLKP